MAADAAVEGMVAVVAAVEAILTGMSQCASSLPLSHFVFGTSCR
jgi:hypothetical protein